MLGHRRTAERLADLTAEVERAGEEERAATERLKETEQKVQGGNIEVARLRDQIRDDVYKFGLLFFTILLTTAEKYHFCFTIPGT